MIPTIRPAAASDIEPLADLLLADAQERHSVDPGLWRLDPAARDKVLSALEAAIKGEAGPVRQQWLVAEAAGRLIGTSHSILLPVPPIYAGEFGPPGLIMEDCHVAPDAPRGTRRALLDAAEADLVEAGAAILLASSVPAGAWESEYAQRGYRPLTAYFAKTGLEGATPDAPLRAATQEDVAGIVAASAAHRQVLERLHPAFWKPHAEADRRFAAWMQRSLTLDDRDMFVADDGRDLRGYAISQPATPLHFPTPHDIAGVGVIDDFHHFALGEPETVGADAAEAAALFSAAECARARRGDHSILVVCPADWHSKRELLEKQGYHGAITWHIRIAGRGAP